MLVLRFVETPAICHGFQFCYFISWIQQKFCFIERHTFEQMKLYSECERNSVTLCDVISQRSQVAAHVRAHDRIIFYFSTSTVVIFLGYFSVMDDSSVITRRHLTAMADETMFWRHNEKIAYLNAHCRCGCRGTYSPPTQYSLTINLHLRHFFRTLSLFTLLLVAFSDVSYRDATGSVQTRQSSDNSRYID